MKNYQVFYWIKKNSREYLDHMFVSANNAKEACRICKEQVKEQTGRNAFRPTTKGRMAFSTWLLLISISPCSRNVQR